MLQPTVKLDVRDGHLTAEFWDCLRLDPTPVRDLRTQYEHRCKQGQGPDLIVDLNGVGFAGSAALSGFINLQRDCRKRGGRLAFCNVDPTVRDAFEISRLGPMFTFGGAFDDAVRTLREKASPKADDGAPGPSRDAPPRQAPPLRRRSSGK